MKSRAPRVIAKKNTKGAKEEKNCYLKFKAKEILYKTNRTILNSVVSFLIIIKHNRNELKNQPITAEQILPNESSLSFNLTDHLKKTSNMLSKRRRFE